MKIGERIQKIRKIKGMTQRELGLEMGFPYMSADVRIAQYENSMRIPKQDTIDRIGEILQVNPGYLAGPQGDSAEDIIRFFFDLEDLGYHIEIHRHKGEIVLIVSAPQLNEPLKEWRRTMSRSSKGELSGRDYQLWKACWSIE